MEDMYTNCMTEEGYDWLNGDHARNIDGKDNRALFEWRQVTSGMTEKGTWLGELVS